MAKIRARLKCINIAPLANLDKEFENNSLKIGVFANNGCGKTFISRMFRLLEPSVSGEDEAEMDTSKTDRLISFGEKNALFGFEIADENGSVIEDISIKLTRFIAPSIPSAKYRYHTFNQDYVDENIRALNFEHTEDVQGFILGKSNIDLSDDNNALQEIIIAKEDIKAEITSKIEEYIKKYITPIPNIRRLGDYSQFVSAEVFLAKGDSLKLDLPKSVNDYIADFDKVKSVPEFLEDISSLDSFVFPEDLYSEIQTTLTTPFTLSNFGESFKVEMRAKQEFVEKGLTFIKTSAGRCPFCKQVLGLDALSLIDRYNEFVANEEAKTIKRIQTLIQLVENKRKELASIKIKNVAAISRFNEYKTKYIPSCEDKNLIDLDLTSLDECLQSILLALREKSNDISVSVAIDPVIVGLSDSAASFNHSVDSNNLLLSEINLKKNSLGEESKSIRRSICKAAYLHWIDKYGKDQEQYMRYCEQEETLRNKIEIKRASRKIERKKLVAETIKKVLDYFFSGKYTLDEDTFRLVFQARTLEKDQTKDVLSEGEKNIIAFAYYLGDTHTLIDKEEDYKQLFFIIDDPISSMDFTYVYTLSGVIREIKELFPKIERVHHMVLTHNSDFIRILYSNKILDKVMLLKNSKLQEWNDNFTVPYINHLLDVYRIARKGEKASHTTANSIRHIIETIDKFERVCSNEDSVKEYIKKNIPNNKKSYTYINDLSHGGWRTEQPPMTDDDYKEVCEAIVTLVNTHYPDQIKYCEGNS